MSSTRLLGLAAALGLLHGTASAEVVRFRYAPMNSCGQVTLVPGPQGAPGERMAWLGGVPEPYPRNIRPTHVVTFQNPSGQLVHVPFTFPDGTPRIEQRGDRVIYNYSSYQILAQFLPDGTVTVTYNSGALRPISFQ